MVLYQFTPRGKFDISTYRVFGFLMDKIVVIAGYGDLPHAITQKLDELNHSYDVISITDNSQFPIGHIGKILNHIKSLNAHKIVFCGAIKRPSFLKMNLDKTGKEWLVKLGYRVFLGDDALLKGVRQLLLKEGLEVISPHDILGTLLTPSGILTNRQPDKAEMFDIARGIFVLNTLSKADVGQAVVIQEGLVIGIEAIEGTKNLILRSKNLKISEIGGILVKTAKIKQDKGIDLPTIGPSTIMECVESKLNGIAVGANSSQIIDYNNTIKLANEHNIFIIGI